MNYYFSTNNFLLLVKNVKHDDQRVTYVNNTVNNITD